MELIKYSKLKQIFLAKIKDIKTKGFSLVEVLVSLAIISSAILIILTSVARATQRATLNKLHSQMVTAAASMLATTRSIMYKQYKDSDWSNILNGNIQLQRDTHGNLVIQPASPTCIPTHNPLSSSCPTLDQFIEGLDYLAYVIHTESISSQKIYKMTITIACREQTKCNPQKITPVKNELYIIKY